MDIQSFLRLKSLFGQPMVQPGLDTYSNSNDSFVPGEGIDNTQLPDTSSNLLDSYQPRNAISSQLTSALSNIPQRPVPSRLRNIGASIAGLGAGSSPIGIAGGQPIGFKYNPQAAEYASDKVKYGDFDNQMTDWQNKVKALGIGATEEDRANAGEVIRLKNQATAEIGQRKNEIAQQRADSYQQNADTKITEEANKHETAMTKLRDNVAKADANLALAKQKFDVNKTNTEFMQKYHQAELASIAARREAQTEDDKFKLEDQKRRTDSTIERNRILNERSPTNDKTTETQLFDANGQVTTDPTKAVRKVVKSGPTQKMVPVVDKDGNPGSVPENKVDEFIQQHGGSRR